MDNTRDFGYRGDLRLIARTREQAVGGNCHVENVDPPVVGQSRLHRGFLRFCFAPLMMALVLMATSQQAVGQKSQASLQNLIKTHCAKCHGQVDPEGDFSMSSLGISPNKDSVQKWKACLEFVKSKEMPPADENKLSARNRQRLIQFLDNKIRAYNELVPASVRTKPRRLNNRELANSIRDVLMIEDVGTHQPTANLLGDTLHDGFDTSGDALGLSQFHLEQYIDAFRKVVDGTILAGKRPVKRHYRVDSDGINMTSRSQNSKRDLTKRNEDSVDFLDIRLRAYFSEFETTPETGRYKIKIRATGVDRGIYDSDATGIYDGDPIQLRVHLGDRVRTFDLPDNEVIEIELDEWIVAGTKFQMSYPTDGLRLNGNGNFKFQYRIAHDYIQENDKELYERVLREEVPRAKYRSTNPGHWVHWTEYWQGPRPRLLSAEIEGPIYETWPPKRQVALLGDNPSPGNAAAILKPIAERAWRREVKAGELEPIARLVQHRAKQLGKVEAFKEGVVAILVSPSFLLINPNGSDADDRFAAKLSYFLKSTTPDQKTRDAVKGGELGSFDSVRQEVQRQFDQFEAEGFLREFPQAWLQLDRINFMAPDPDRFPLYDRKRLSEDMVNEVRHFFRHAIENNIPIPELISADYSFINADLAKVYGVDDVPEDSRFRKYTFTDGRRGGLMGMGAFLTLTADSLFTSPIHRAIYVMENFMGLHPSLPPTNVKINEPDVRQAKTIKEILAAHMSDPSCASCHKTIDPYGYAFENFDPMGGWRDEYTEQITPMPSRAKLVEIEQEDVKRLAKGLPPVVKPWEHEPIPVDSSARFLSGAEYLDIVGYRKHLTTDENQARFVRCFITKLLTYANGVEPDNYSEIEEILSKSVENEYRIVDTIAAVVDSPLFREQ